MSLSNCLTPRERAVLRAVVAQLIPADADPGAEELGVGAFVEERLRGAEERWTLLRRGLAGLEESCHLLYGGKGFLELMAEEQGEVLRSLVAGDLPGPAWSEVSGAELFRLLRDNAIYGYYTTPEARRSIGYPGPAQPHGYPDYDSCPGEAVPGGKESPVPSMDLREPQGPARPAGRPLSAAPGPSRPAPSRDRYDVLIVGAGAAGGVLAQLLSQKGASVLVLEAGPWWDPASDYCNDELEMHKLNWPWSIGWEGADPVRPVSGWGVGGSTQRYLGWSPRFQEADFQVRSRDGVAEDWPIGYTDLEPYYEWVERMIGVAGGEGGSLEAPRGPYPMPPHRFHCNAQVVAEGARRLGLWPLPAPSAINSLRYSGRPACNHCGFCAQGCMIGAKGGTLATSLPAAQALGAEIHPRCFVTRIELDSRGLCRGVVYIDPQGNERIQEAAVIVLAANGIQVPRLLLCST
ncbi:MAG: gluconate 2-dehydrogenase subunit 3 family protein, partial [Candidatus Tectomicrobia bacterium]|nr:gluconate 2-dehydrogenase subunit 3 family protein [Candidatus Tectomicrobia bacterium]